MNADKTSSLVKNIQYFLKDIIKKKNDDTNEEYSSSSFSVMALNVTQENGIAATVLDCILAERAQSDGAKRAHEKRKKRDMILQQTSEMQNNLPQVS